MKKRKLAIVIDDQEIIRSMLERVFSSLGYETKLLSSPFEVYCIKENKPKHCKFNDTVPDLLITDIQMPGMSGIELIRHLKENGCKIKKIALMTGFSIDNLDEAAEELNCKAFRKPFEINEIKKWVNE